MSTEPEALRLADALEHMSLSTKWDKQAAKELRRLHAANIDCVDHFNALKAERDELLEALVSLAAVARRSLPDYDEHPEVQKADDGRMQECMEDLRAACVVSIDTSKERVAKQQGNVHKQGPAAYDPLELHVTHSIVAGALYDFMGWLTSRRTRICLSDRDNAGPAADAIADFAKMRGLMLNDAQVESWQKVLVPPPASKPWVGLTIGEIQDLIQFKEHSPFALAEDIEAKLKQKNGYAEEKNHG